MGLVVVQSPIEEPITVERAKLHCRIDHSSDDVLVTAWITAAREWCETFTRRAFVLTRYRQTWDSFPGTRAPLALHRPPLSSVVSLQYLDAAGDLQSLTSPTDFVVYSDGEPALVSPALGGSWPVAADLPGSVRGEFIAGYGAGSAVPESIRSAILLIVGHLNENREATIPAALEEVPMGVRFLLYPFVLGDMP